MMYSVFVDEDARMLGRPIKMCIYESIEDYEEALGRINGVTFEVIDISDYVGMVPGYTYRGWRVHGGYNDGFIEAVCWLEREESGELEREELTCGE